MAEPEAPLTRHNLSSNVMDDQPNRVDMRSRGTTGLKQAGGYINENAGLFLEGQNGIRIFAEMGETDPGCSLILFLVQNTVRSVNWTIQPASERPEDQAAADFVESCLHDMTMPFDDVIAEQLSFIQYGFSLHEIIYKQRAGRSRQGWLNSKYGDGLIGWRGMPIRAQETIERWEFDDAGDLQGAVQMDPYAGGKGAVYLPMDKCMLFRTSSYKNNPQGTALDPTTPIPTPDGWRIMDDLHPGDRIFDEQGKIRYVTNRADWEDRPCYKLTFSNNTSIVADENHQWLVQSAKERAQKKPATIRTTSEIADETRVALSGCKYPVSNFSIAWAQPLQYVRQQQIVPPYYLGLWLGDGDKNTARVACHADDAEETAARLRSLDLSVTVSYNAHNRGASLYVGHTSKKWSHEGPVYGLRAIGVLKNKHIPSSYLLGDIEQRRELLQGLMDSDGYVNAAGQCEFTNTNKKLVAGVFDLVTSLGISASVARKLHNETGKPYWLVRFTPMSNVFLLRRKTSKCKLARARQNHYVKDCEPVEHRRTVCIEVDGPSHLYLAGRGCIPTHNSAFKRAYRPYYFKRQLETVEAIGIERDLAGLPVVWLPPQIMDQNASPENKQLWASFKDIVTKVRRNELEGIMMPLVYDEKGHKVFDINLMASAGNRQFDLTKSIDRLNKEIFRSALAQFLLLGSDASAGGSWALSTDMTNTFLLSLRAYLRQVRNVWNDAIKRLVEINGMQLTDYPQLVHSNIQQVDIKTLSEAFSQFTSAGVVLTPNEDIDRHVSELLGFPTARNSKRDARVNENVPAHMQDNKKPAEHIHADTPVESHMPSDVQRAQSITKPFGNPLAGNKVTLS